MGVASIALSIPGIVVTVLIVIIIVVLWAVGLTLVAQVSVLVVIAYGELALRWCCGVVVSANRLRFNCSWTRGRRKMHFSFSVVNENADENEISLSAEKRKRKSPVPISQNYLRFSCEHNIFGPTQMTFLERKRKIKRKCKFIFGRKRKKPKMTKQPIFGAENENEFRSASKMDRATTIRRTVLYDCQWRRSVVK